MSFCLACVNGIQVSNTGCSKVEYHFLPHFSAPETFLPVYCIDIGLTERQFSLTLLLSSGKIF